ncbi:MAG: M12 family metallo-peptidase [Bacteroidota bacterium]|nr:M12 family metallo-peptidase [Bacteroidota bacterium]
MKINYFIFLALLAVGSVVTPATMLARENGEPGKVTVHVAELLQNATRFRDVNVFHTTASQFNEKAEATIHNYNLLQLRSAELKSLLQTQPEFIRVSVPASNTVRGMNLLLYKVNISGNGFTLLTSDGRSMSELNAIVHYRGIIENDMNSVASISFSEEETMALISNKDGNFVIGELENANGNEYVYYNDKDLIPAFAYECGTNTSNPPTNQQQQQNNTPGLLSVNCVDWYYEIDHDVFVGKGSLANVNSYIQGVFNQVSTLYNNDGISITLQTLYVWTATDPYTGPSTGNYLNQFGAYRTSFAGDLANLVGYAGGGGVAYVDGLCSSTQYKMGYMGISSSYNTVPTYSWTVEVVTHEDGHLLGSLHTHDCVWNGNNTAIDGCGDAAGYNGSGACATASVPVSGTIMSYCHLVSGVGINFNNGFGSQPTNVMLSNINTASCLSACSGCPTPSQPGSITGTTSYCGTSTQTYSVTAVSGATSYTWTQPSGWSGSSTTNSITVTTSATGGTISVTANNSCGSSSARTLTITGNSTPSQPGNLTGSTSVCQSASQTYSISAVNGATSYNWTLPSGWSGSSSSNSITATPGASGGTVSVAAVNSCGASTVRSITVSVNAIPVQPGSISGTSNVCAATSYTYSVSSVAGATSYTWTLPSGWIGSSVSNSITVTSGSAGGNITVKANNSCGSGTVRSFVVSMAAAPAQPGAVSSPGGITKVCPGDVKTYSISAVSGATSYTWTPPNGSTITNGQGTTTVTVNYNSGFTASDSIKVVSTNGCAVSAVRFRKITRNTPVKPGVITGSVNNVCNGTNVPYSVSNVTGMNYNWTFSTGSASVSGGQGTSNITASFTPNFLTGIINVTASNGCGISAARTLSVSAVPAQPSPLSGTTTPCASQSGVPYSTTPVAGAISYTWTVPSGARINDGTVTSTSATLTTTATAVTVNFSTAAGYVSVKATNACGTGINRSLTTTFNCRLAASDVSQPLILSVYPNPASDEIRVQFESAAVSVQQIKIIDPSGKIYLVQDGKSNVGINEVAIDIRQLSPGIYFLEVVNGNDKNVSKISVE